MIIVRSPLRISFAGGGTDIPAFYEKYGPGVVVSTSIDKHIYVTLSKKFDGKVSLRYRVHENRDSVDQLEHPLVREVLRHYGVKSGVEMTIISDAPASGSGLGASSALACALAAALERYIGRDIQDKDAIASIAAKIEIDRVGSPIGKQDHYSSAFGGVNMFRFMPDGMVEREAFEGHDFISELSDQSMLFYLNIQHTYLDARTKERRRDTHFVQKILKEQVQDMDRQKKIYEMQRDNAVALWQHMAYEVPERFIDHVNENWRIKKSTHPEITNAKIEDVIARATAAGATAAKVCGAGGGGFVYFVVPPFMQQDVRRALSDLTELRFSFESRGTQVVFDDETTRMPCEVR